MRLFSLMTAALSCALVAATVLVASPAHAAPGDSVSKRDPRGDPYGIYSRSDLQKAPTIDMRRFGLIDQRRDRLKFFIKVRNLQTDHMYDARYNWSAIPSRRTGYRYWKVRLEDREILVENRSDGSRTCARARYAYQVRKDTVSVSLPRSCVGGKRRYKVYASTNFDADSMDDHPTGLEPTRYLRVA